MTEAAAKDKRRFTRVRVSLDVTIRCTDGRLTHARAVDLSEGGMYVEYESSAEQGRVLDMFFDLPFAQDFKRIYVKGEVVRAVVIGNRDVFGIAFNFIQFARQSDLFLQKYIEIRGTKTGM